MRERPILFSGPMVKPILNMKPDVWPPEPIDPSKPIKWQTRRVCKAKDVNGKPLSEYTGEALDALIRQHCPYGRLGDRLWVRESFWGCDMPGQGDTPCVVYDDEHFGKSYEPKEVRPWARKFGRIPSIHMPRDASRINLEIMSTRVENVQDISHNDALAEGVDSGRWLKGEGERKNPHNSCAWNRFAALWDTINAARGYGWDKNPQVWVEEFKRVGE